MPRINTDGHGWCFVGVDLGQAKDFTAVAVLECAEVSGACDAVVYARRKRVELRLRQESQFIAKDTRLHRINVSGSCAGEVVGNQGFWGAKFGRKTGLTTLGARTEGGRLRLPGADDEGWAKISGSLRRQLRSRGRSSSRVTNHPRQ